MARFFLMMTLFLPYVAYGMEEIEIVIKDHKFTPEKIMLKSNQKYKLLIRNEDVSAEEFESHDLRREKLVAGGKSIKIPIGPLKSGRYRFFGEFHQKTAQGVIIIE